MIPLMRCMYYYSENDRILSSCLKLSVLSSSEMACHEELIWLFQLSIGLRRSSLSEFQTVIWLVFFSLVPDLSRPTKTSTRCRLSLPYHAKKI